MEDVAVNGNFHIMEQGGEEGPLRSVKIGVICNTDIQVAINEGNRQGHTFFLLRMGKAGITPPYQQVLPTDFARYHANLHLEDTTLEAPCGRTWGVMIRTHTNTLRFGKGWRHFAVDNNLQEGYQLLFHLVGGSSFRVKFFDNFGKSMVSFPLVTPMPASVEPHSPSRRDDEYASEPPPFETPITEPPPLETPIDEPPLFEMKSPSFETQPPLEKPIVKPPTIPATPQGKPPALTSNIAKVMLHQYLKPQGELPALNSDTAKVTLQQYYMQKHSKQSTEVPNSKATVPTEDVTDHSFNPREGLIDVGGVETEHVGNQGSYKERATVEGKAYILIDSDDDDELVRPDLPKLFIRTPRKRDHFEGRHNNHARGSYLREQTGLYSSPKRNPPKNQFRSPPKDRFHSPPKGNKGNSPKGFPPARIASNMMHFMHMPEEPVEIVEQDRSDQAHQDDEDDYHFTASKTFSDNTPKYIERQRLVQQKPSAVRGASWEGKGGHGPATFAKLDGHSQGGILISDLWKEKTDEPETASRNFGCHEEIRDTSTRGAVQRPNAVEGHHPMPALSSGFSPSKLLLTQQGCVNYSEIVLKRKPRRVTDEERQRPLTAATRFAAGLKNKSFLVVLSDFQVYHGFQVPIPRDFLEATGTLRANKVKIRLIDSERNCYDTKWKWRSNFQTPFLNCDGWAKFALDHKLEEGDVCVFELIGPGPAILLSVHIFFIVAENSARDNSIHELRGGQSAPLIQKFRRQALAANNIADQEQCRGRKRPANDLDQPNLQKTSQKPKLQAWTKLFKPRVKSTLQR